MTLTSNHTILPTPPGGVKIQQVVNGFIVTVSDGVNVESEQVRVFNAFYDMMEFVATEFGASLHLTGELAVDYAPDGPCFEVDWDKVDKEYNYVAMDSSGAVYAYKNLPVLVGPNADLWTGQYFNDYIALSAFHYSKESGDNSCWRDSLVTRPNFRADLIRNTFGPEPSER